MFKKDSSEFSRHYSLGKVDEICESHDNQVRNVWIRYKNLNEKSSRRVQRDVKTIFKIIGIEDTSLHSSLEQALDIAKQVKTMENKSEEGVTYQDRSSGLKNDEDIKDEVISSDSEDCTDRNLPFEGASKRKRRSELELLKDWSLKLAYEARKSDKSDFIGFFTEDLITKSDSMDWTDFYFDQCDAKTLGIEASDIEVIFIDGL